MFFECFEGEGDVSFKYWWFFWVKRFLPRYFLLLGKLSSDANFTLYCLGMSLLHD